MNLPNLDIVQTFISRRLIDTLKRSLHSKTPLFQMSCKNRGKKPNTLWSEKNENLILICVKDLRHSLQYRNHCSGSWHCSTCLEDDMLSHEQANEATFFKCKWWKLSSTWPKVSREPKPPAALSCTSHSRGASLGAVYLPDHPLHPRWGPRDSHFQVLWRAKGMVGCALLFLQLPPGQGGAQSRRCYTCQLTLHQYEDSLGWGKGHTEQAKHR